MEQKPEDLTGLTLAEGKEYVFHHIAALKLLEKELQSLAEEAKKWQDRAVLADSRNNPSLAEEARGEAANITAKIDALTGEKAELEASIEKMRLSLPALAARERSVDPDVLEQELGLLMGKTPGEEEETRERDFAALEQDAAANAALEALKAKMKKK